MGWQGRQDSNLQPLVLETSALPIELHPSDGHAQHYFVSRCSRCCRQRGQNLFSSSRPGSFLLFFRVLYVRSLQTVHARAITGRFSALATGSDFLVVPAGGHAELGRGDRGKAARFYSGRATTVNDLSRRPARRALGGGARPA